MHLPAMPPRPRFIQPLLRHPFLPLHCRYHLLSCISTSPVRQISYNPPTMTRPELSVIMSQISRGELPWGSVFSDKMLTTHWSQSSGWTNVKLQPYGPLSLAPSSSIFHYGMQVFEGLKAYKTADGSAVRLFRPELNIARLNKSAERIALPTVDNEWMLDLLKGFVDVQREWVPEGGTGGLYLRVCVMATEEKIGVKRSEKAMMFIIASPVGGFFGGKGRGYLDGVKLLAGSGFIRAWKGGMGYCKTGGNYACSVMPAEKAKERGFDQVLWLNGRERGLVGEVGMMNVFFVVSDGDERTILTPKLDGTILDGVTRRSVLELAKGMGIGVEERDIEVEEICEAVDAGRIVEIFGTGTAAVVCPVHSVTFREHTVAVKPREKDGDLSVLFREELLDIQNSNEVHPWMVSVSGGEEFITGGQQEVEEVDVGKGSKKAAMEITAIA